MRERRSGDEPVRLSPPTPILWAGGDAFLERSLAEAGLVLCDAGTLQLVEGASHWLHIGKTPLVDARIVEWLA